MMYLTTNANPQTGVRYGVASANDHNDLYDRITQDGTNTSYEYWISEIRASLNCLDGEDLNRDELAAMIEGCLDFSPSEEDMRRALDDALEVEEPGGAVVEGTISDRVFGALECNLGNNYESDEEDYELDDGDTCYQISWLGGAPMIWVLKSPVIVFVKSLCSPCVPNAGDLDSGLTSSLEGYKCYGIPGVWK